VIDTAGICASVTSTSHTVILHDGIQQPVRSTDTNKLTKHTHTHRQADRGFVEKMRGGETFRLPGGLLKTLR